MIRALAAALGLVAVVFGLGVGCGDVIGLPSSTTKLSKLCFSCDCPTLEAQGDAFVAACKDGIDAELSATLGEEVSDVCDDPKALNGLAAQEGSITGALRDAVDDGCGSSCANLGACFVDLTGAREEGACSASLECSSFACCAEGVTLDIDGVLATHDVTLQVASQSCCSACSSCGEMLQAVADGNDTVSGCAESVPKLEALLDACRPQGCEVKCATNLDPKPCLLCVAQNAGKCADLAESAAAYVACDGDFARPIGTP